ncbi:NADH-quinone oxidoreductase subunit NuoG [Rhodosalinus sediminis]|uniref:NADH-quinone oxidoreductase subunit NuoG n=1 Tax=Rhodosalinus sediminis TaxID=1940533 RepID=A0A3D9BXG2_9RHOB|nr:NADH-quinone oxidoreductase subunit NuoG [Rhodosalinus sediminis]REC58179.1 NADH-quinone oxidoreductase subunit NuoG [Rhodosalinus sediminis]
MSKVRLTIDGIEREVEAGQDLLSASLGLGVDVPHFCWHAALGSVGACRLCAVRVHDGAEDTTGRIEMACMTPVAEGQRVELADPEAYEMRARVIEWLMVNHPHDCAVCEEGGACHLQDMTVATGHHRRRYRFTKRTHRNQDLGPLLTHEMNRCIACYRCTRFYRGYAGGRDLDVFGAHDRVYFGRYEDGPLESPFAGNLAEVCPTGVFNDKGWSETYARKWDMAATPVICTGCSVGCNLFAAERDGRVRRVQNRYHGAINGHFICDRGRFGTLHVTEDRLDAARVGGTAAPVAEATAAARAALAQGAVGLGSPRASLETNAALRHLVGPERFFAAVPEREARAVGRMAAWLATGRAASLKEMEQADAVLVLGADLTGVAPRAALALRQTARGAADALAAEKGVPAWLDNAARGAGEGRKTPIALVTPMPDALDDVATWALRRAPEEIAPLGRAVAAALGGAAADEEAAGIARALHGAERPLIVVGADGALVEAAGALAEALGDGARLALFPPEANSLGLALTGAGGLEGAVAALEAGQARTAVIAEADLFERAEAELVERLFAAAETVVALDSAETETIRRADIVLPVADWSEAAGTFVNHEGRAQRSFAAVPNGRSAGWRAIRDLCAAAPAWETLDDMLAAMAADLPQLAPARAAAPDAAHRLPLGQVARAPWRMSGRTAHDLAGRVPEGTPARDTDAPLAFSMEGAHGTDAPPALRTGYAVPGLHSASAAPRVTDGPRGPLKAGDPGAFVLQGVDAPARETASVPEDAATGAGLIPLALDDPFAGDELFRRAARLADRCPAPVVALHPEDAAARGLAAGMPVAVAGAAPVALTLDGDVPRGHVAASVGRVLPRGARAPVTVEAAS